jgi:hypothetical protein
MNNAQKTPMARSLNLFAQRKAMDEIEKLGMALPGHVVAVAGSIVTVNFDVEGLTLDRVAMPLATSEYIRLPVQVGDKGVAEPSDAYLGGISGLGGGVADLTLRGNLSTLVWKPVANANWAAAPDANTLWMYGKNRTRVSDSVANNAHIDVTANGITLQFGAHSIVIDATGVTIDGKLFLPHTHSGVTTGGGNTGAVV